MAEEFPERLQEKLPGKERGSFVETDKHQSLLVSENGGYCLWGGKTPKGSHNGPHSPSGSSKADVSQGHPGAEVSGELSMGSSGFLLSVHFRQWEVDQSTDGPWTQSP